MANQIMQHFTYEHLPESLQEVSYLCCLLAEEMDRSLDDCAEKSAGLRHLMEAKDCFVRAKIEMNWKDDTL